MLVAKYKFLNEMELDYRITVDFVLLLLYGIITVIHTQFHLMSRLRMSGDYLYSRCMPWPHYLKHVINGVLLMGYGCVRD